MAIPKIIHQVWEGRTEPKMPTRLQILARTWREQNPDWEYHLWNGEEMDELVEKHFPEYLSMYRSFPYNVQRWDTIRYMILYVYGGVYTDLDTECFRPMTPLLENVTIGFGEEPPIPAKPIRIGNAFLVSEKGNPGWLTILNEILTNTEEKESTIETVMHSTGPNMINRLFDRLKKENGAYGFPYSQVTPVSKYDMYRYIFQGEKEVFFEKIKQAYCTHYFFGSWDTKLAFY
ncbi:MAG: hypothetical protein PARBB_02671 [Parabacteroides distasonis]